MNSFVNSVSTQPVLARTNNGAVTLESSMNKCVDYFFLAGASRQKVDHAVSAFMAAYAENPEIATRLALWTRDARGGAGERNVFRKIVEAMSKTRHYKKFANSVIRRVPELGRFDDLYEFIRHDNLDVRNLALSVFASAIREGNGLACKWADRKGPNAILLRNAMGLSPKQYRKMIVNGSSTVEQNMCAKNWSEINYSHVPSVAARAYQSAFARNDSTRYSQYRNSLAKVLSGEMTSKEAGVKVNASVLFPHDVVRNLRYGIGEKIVNLAQWEALPNFTTPGRAILPMVDVSGSMNTQVSGSVSAMDVSIGIGLYLADKQKTPFHGMFLTFSSLPKLVKLEGSIELKIHQLSRADWGMSTNLEKAFERILNHAVVNRVPESDMPEFLMILSDMEFDASQAGGYTNFESAKKMFRNYGYKLPKVVFWNLNGRLGNVPANANQNDVALVSGFSTSILKSLLAGDLDGFSPKSVMLETIMKERYDI